MPSANTNPLFTLTPNPARVSIPTTNAQTKSDGTSAGAGADLMYLLLTVGANGTYIDSIRFFSVASSAATNSIATTLRAYVSSVAAPGATTSANTFLIGEVSAALQAASHSTNACNYVEISLKKVFKSGDYILVSQHVAQTANQNWIAIAFAGDY